MGKKEIKLLYTETFKDRSEAMKREIAIKKLSRKEKEELVKGYSSLPNSQVEQDE